MITAEDPRQKRHLKQEQHNDDVEKEAIATRSPHGLRLGEMARMIKLDNSFLEAAPQRSMPLVDTAAPHGSCGGSLKDESRTQLTQALTG